MSSHEKRENESVNVFDPSLKQEARQPGAGLALCCG